MGGESVGTLKFQALLWRWFVPRRFRNYAFRSQRVFLDGRRFKSCTFTDCTLVYGGGRVSFDNIRVDQSVIVLTGAAANTEMFRQAMESRGVEALTMLSPR
jgi:hypothetical protein